MSKYWLFFYFNIIKNGHHTDWLGKNYNNTDFTPFYFKLDNYNVLKILVKWDLLI